MTELEDCADRDWTGLMTLAEQARRACEMNVREWSRMLGVSASTVFRWERDQRKPTGTAIALFRLAVRQPELVTSTLGVDVMTDVEDAPLEVAEAADDDEFAGDGAPGPTNTRHIDFGF